jgi:hypothetical protein
MRLKMIHPSSGETGARRRFISKHPAVMSWQEPGGIQQAKLLNK